MAVAAMRTLLSGPLEYLPLRLNERMDKRIQENIFEGMHKSSQMDKVAKFSAVLLLLDNWNSR